MAALKTKVIVNPVAGSKTTYRKWPMINELLQSGGMPFEYQYTEGIGHAIELAREATASGYQFLVAVGGDGTVNEVANGIMLSKDASEATIGIISTGTGGDFIRTAGITKDYVKACASLHEIKKRMIDVGVVEYVKDGQPCQRYFINSAGIGFDAQAIEASSRLPKIFGGTVPYVLGLLQAVVSYRNRDINVCLGEMCDERKVLTMVMANGCYFGGGMCIAPQADIYDGFFDVVCVGDINKFDLLKTFPKIYKGTHITHPMVKIERASSVSIKSTEKVVIQADGEFLGECPASFRIIPAALSLAL
ncbi:MAG: diacylglycerol kinase family protein [Dehalococcoidales bacterium]|jgi:YegS/Rv2252/BmrU family lipid kinase|nr:diacylglycerol kinase family lipid kinase [Dehalococcoidales bacterium]MDD3994560.1 diacylglycerol kinase family lipid kinase [Dehalococcoidales bacterium]NLT28626.1 diacylglycerol kinase family lipid kinase [Dehalococcoidales bacterium]